MGNEKTIHITIDLPIEHSRFLELEGKENNRSKRQQLKEIVKNYYELLEEEKTNNSKVVYSILPKSLGKWLEIEAKNNQSSISDYLKYLIQEEHKKVRV